MSWTDEEIDKLAREGAANSSVEYKNEYWTEFEAMLPVAGKKDFLWFFTAFLFIGLMGTSFVFNGLVKDGNDLTVNNKFELNESRNVSEKVDILKDEINETKNAKNRINNNEIENTETETNFNNSFNGSTRTTKTTSIKSTKSAKKPTLIKAIINSENGLLAEYNDNGTSESSAKKEVDTDSKKDNNLANKSNETSQSTEAGYTPVSDLRFRVLNEFGYDQSLMPLMDFSKQKLPSIATFYVNGFGGLSQSLITPSNDITTSFGLGIGAQIQKGKFTFTTGMNGVWSNHKDLNLSRSAKVYGFGSNEYNYQFKYKQIYLIEAELTAGYKMGKHLINLGVRPSFVIGTKVAVVQSVNDEKTMDRNEYGYVDGLNRFGIKPTLGYSFDIAPSFKVGINLGVELMSKIQEGYLVGSNNRFPIDGQLYLRKSIRFKR